MIFTTLVSTLAIAKSLNKNASDSIRITISVRNIDTLRMDLWTPEGKKSINLKNGKGAVSLKLDRVSELMLFTDPSVIMFDDSSVIRFLAEPSDITISLSLANGVAKDVRIYGSRAQTDIEKWKQENYNFLKSVIDLRSELGRLIKQPPKMEAGSVKALQDSARLRLQLTYDKIGRSVFQLVESNPASYAGAYLLHWYKTNVPLDSLKKYYLKLSPSVQQAEFSVSLFDYLFTLSNDEFRAGNGNKLSRDLNKARSLYDFTIKDQNEENIKLSQFKGKPVLLFFWATWCSSCHQYERYLNDLMESLESDSIHFISVSLDKIDDFQKSNKKIRLPCITLLDSENTLRYFYRFLYVPTFIILDHKGGIVFNNSSISSLKDSIYQALERYHEDVQIKAK